MNLQEVIGAINEKWLERLEKLKAEIPSMARFESADGQDLVMAVDILQAMDQVINPKKNSDILTVSFDSALNDESGLCVIRKCGEKSIILKMELGEQADILYHLLTDQMTKAEIKSGWQEKLDKLKAEILSMARWESSDGQDLVMAVDILQAIDQIINSEEREVKK